MNPAIKISRREALKVLGIGTPALILGVNGCFKGRYDGTQKAEVPYSLGVFFAILADNRVQIVCHRSEMGQGVRTALPMILAEELDVPWESVAVVQAEGDSRFGNQNTDGSTSVTEHWQSLRKTAGAARQMLLQAAAIRWKVSPVECRTSEGYVFHDSSSRRAAYGSLVAAAQKLDPPKDPTLKSQTNYKIIGSKKTHVDARKICDGSAVFGIDVEVPGMLHAVLLRAPRINTRLKSFDANAALKMRDIVDVLEIKGQPQSINTNDAVAVIAKNTWSALKAREHVLVVWDEADSPKQGDAQRKLDLKEALKKNGKVVRLDGRVGIQNAGHSQNVYAAEFYTPYLVHAQMEPLCATAYVTDEYCEIWAPTQDPQRARAAAAAFLGLDESRVKVNVTLLGGGFGRKAQSDFVHEAVAVSKQLKKPVKVTWSREDDTKHGFYHSDCLQSIKVKLDTSGYPQEWFHKTAFPTVLGVFEENATIADDFETNFGASNLPYRIPNVRVEHCGILSPVRVGWLRSVNNLYHAFAVNTVIDDLSCRAGIDPVEYRLKLLDSPKDLENDALEKKSNIKQNTGRLAEVIKYVAKEADWGHAPQGFFKGFASHYSFHTYVAVVATISLDGGKVRVRRLDIAVDCGIVINPDTVIAQIEGAAVFGVSAALYGKISLANGQVLQDNFHNYPVVRMNECPDIRVYLTKSSEHPSGIGEPGVPPIAPAIGNAIFSATKKRLFEMPFT